LKLKNTFLTSIFLTAFLDMLGVGIIIPIIPALFYTKHLSYFSNLGDTNTIRWTFCLLMASFSFMQFFGAPILGAMSDRIGRKKVIQIALVGTAVGYALFGIALSNHSLFLLFLSRIIPGFFGGSLSVLFSSISDVSSSEDKPKNFALVGIAFALGFIFGPLIGGFLSDKSIVSWFTLSTPFILATCLALLNFIFVHFFFQETLTVKKDTKISFFKGFTNVHKAFTNVNLRILFTITFLNTLGFSFFTQFFSVFMYNKFHVSQKTVGLIFGWVGICLIFSQGFLVRKISKKYQPQVIINYTMVLMGTFILCLIFPKNIEGIMICNFLIAMSQGLNSPNLLSIVSKQASQADQGETMGINQSMQSLAQFAPPIFVGFFGENLNNFPFIFGGLSIVLGWFVFAFLFNKK